MWVKTTIFSFFTYQIALATPGPHNNARHLRWSGSPWACRLHLRWSTADLRVWTATSPMRGCRFRRRGWSACGRWRVPTTDEAVLASPNDLHVTTDTHSHKKPHKLLRSADHNHKHNRLDHIYTASRNKNLPCLYWNFHLSVGDSGHPPNTKKLSPKTNSIH